MTVFVFTEQSRRKAVKILRATCCCNKKRLCQFCKQIRSRHHRQNNKSESNDSEKSKQESAQEDKVFLVQASILCWERMRDDVCLSNCGLSCEFWPTNKINLINNHVGIIMLLRGQTLLVWKKLPSSNYWTEINWKFTQLMVFFSQRKLID